jgi:hypothetical protein
MKPEEAIYAGLPAALPPDHDDDDVRAAGRPAADAGPRRRLRAAPPLGFAMVGGLILSQMLTLFTTPVVYLYLDRQAVPAKVRAASRISTIATRPQPIIATPRTMSAKPFSTSTATKATMPISRASNKVERSTPHLIRGDVGAGIMPQCNRFFE